VQNFGDLLVDDLSRVLAELPFVLRDLTSQEGMVPPM
jgi:hypothetical protein